MANPSQVHRVSFVMVKSAVSHLLDISYLLLGRQLWGEDYLSLAKLFGHILREQRVSDEYV